VGAIAIGATGTSLVAETWNGSTWTVMGVPDPLGSQPSLPSVSCTTSKACVAVGDYFRNNVTRTFSEIWNGMTWRLIPTVNPSSEFNFFSSVACTAATVCQAVGLIQEQKVGQKQLVEAWNGKTWYVRSTPSPSFPWGQQLTGISCTDSTSCVAVGFTEGAETTTLIESWNGTAWSSSSSPSTVELYSILYGVSCSGANFCLAVGIQSANQIAWRSLAAVWNGQTWSDIPSANSPKSTEDLLNGVSCPDPVACEAVGSGTSNSGRTTFTLAEREAS
jgi:hypothetical protein